LVSFLFAVLLLTVPPCPMESAPLPSVAPNVVSFRQWYDCNPRDASALGEVDFATYIVARWRRCIASLAWINFRDVFNIVVHFVRNVAHIFNTSLVLYHIQ